MCVSFLLVRALLLLINYLPDTSSLSSGVTVTEIDASMARVTLNNGLRAIWISLDARGSHR